MAYDQMGTKRDKMQCKQNVFDMALNYIAANTRIFATLPPAGKLKTDRESEVGALFLLLSSELFFAKRHQDRRRVSRSGTGRA
jgi:hypothetical protein